MPDGVCPFADWRPVQSFSAGSRDRVGFCDHTAGGFYRTLADVSFWNGQGISVHFGISRKGEIVQLVNIFDRAYAQGRLGPVVTWPPYAQMGKQNPNEYLISTEHEDAETINGRTVFVPNATWTPEQYDADLRVKRWCIDEVKRVTGQDLMRFGIDSLAGHHMFDGVNRAQCPGPAWRSEYRQRLFDDLQGGNVNPQEELELADRRALSLVLKEIGMAQGDDYLYTPVSVAEKNGMLLVEFWKKDRTRPAEPVPSIWVRKP